MAVSDENVVYLGDEINVLMAKEKISFPEALERLAIRHGLTKKETFMDDRMIPSPVEARAYERLHKFREEHIETARRAREYQAQAAQLGGSSHAAFIVGAIFGAVTVTIAAIIIVVAVVVT